LLLRYLIALLVLAVLLALFEFLKGT